MSDIVTPIVTNMLTNFDRVVKTYEANIEKLKILDSETQDLLHEIELAKPKSASEGYSIYKKLKKVREERRSLKDQNELLEGMYQFCKNDKKVSSQLKQIQSNVSKTVQVHNKRCYTAKVRSDLTISPNKPITDNVSSLLRKFRQEQQERRKYKYL